MQNSYLRLRSDPSTNKFHPVLEGLEDATRIINGIFRIKVTPRVAFRVLSHLYRPILTFRWKMYTHGYLTLISESCT